MNAIATPKTKNGRINSQIAADGVITIESQVRPIANAEKPKPTTDCGWARSTILPTNGASTPLVIAIGAVSSAEGVGDNPDTGCAQNISGKIIAVAANAMTAAATLDRLKSRSRNISSGI